MNVEVQCMHAGARVVAVCRDGNALSTSSLSFLASVIDCRRLRR